MAESSVFVDVIVQPAERVTPLSAKAPLFALQTNPSLWEAESLHGSKLLSKEVRFSHVSDERRTELLSYRTWCGIVGWVIISLPGNDALRGSDILV